MYTMMFKDNMIYMMNDLIGSYRIILHILHEHLTSSYGFIRTSKLFLKNLNDILYANTIKD